MQSTHTPPTCVVEDCEKPSSKRGWCHAHYWRWRKYGDPRHGGPIKTAYRDPEQAFLARTERRSDCLIWTGSKNDRGYGKLIVNGRLTYAHVYAWERQNGPVPSGMDIDHRYRCDKLCCEIEHLRVATRAENLWNRVGPGVNRVIDLPRNVYLNKKTGTYFVKVTKNGERHHFGTYRTVKEAEKVAQKARADLHGDFVGKP